MAHPKDYATKLARLESATLLGVLQPTTREFIRRQAARYRFTHQELRQMSQAARDLEMWCEQPLAEWWQQAEERTSATGRERKKALMAALHSHLRSLAAEPKRYPESGFVSPPRRRVRLEKRDTSRQIFGLCPAYSEQIVCCGLHTLDAVRGCPFACSYCTIQTFYGETAELESDLATKLAALEIDPSRRIHVGTGQASDSLVWGNRGDILDALLDFAAAHPNVLLELKTKSDRVDSLLARRVPPNVVCSWSLNTETVIRNEEHGTAPLARRLIAAREVADHGVRVGFHFHPMVYYDGWRQGYTAAASRLCDTLKASEVSFLSMGSVTLIKPVVQEIRRRGGETKILQMEMVADVHGKLTYPDRVKLQLFRHLYSELRPWQPQVLFYLCMEPAPIWQKVFGYAYSDNRLFEQDFLDRCLPRMPIGRTVTSTGASRPAQEVPRTGSSAIPPVACSVNRL